MSRKPYIRPVERRWYLRNAVYKKYMLRESTSVFVGLWMLNLLFGLLRLSQGEAAWNDWLAWQQNPLMFVFGVLTFAMAMFHTQTWFAIAPKAMPKYIAGKKIEHQKAVAAHWAGFAVVSLGVFLLALWGA